MTTRQVRRSEEPFGKGKPERSVGLKGIDYAELRLPVDKVTEEIVKEILTVFRTLKSNPVSPITTQDAVDYASFLIRTTIDMERFSDGTMGSPGRMPTCGGPLQIIVVERSRTLWASKPELRVV